MTPGAGDPVWCSELPAERLAVIAALEIEADILRKHAGHTIGSLYVSGPGLERARAAALRAIGAGAGALVGWGLAGGLSAAAASGTICLPQTITSDVGSWSVDRAWRERVNDVLGARLTVTEEPMYSAATVLTTVADKLAAASHGAVAVDMESAAIAEVASSAGVPCLIVRAVADGPDDVLPDCAGRLVTADGRTRWPGLLEVLGTPAQLPLLLRLARQSGVAQRALRAAAICLAGPAA